METYYFIFSRQSAAMFFSKSPSFEFLQNLSKSSSLFSSDFVLVCDVLSEVLLVDEFDFPKDTFVGDDFL